MAIGYLGFRELPRADGLRHCRDSEHLAEIWAVLDKLGIPNDVADHESDERKEIFERIYVERWTGEVSCE